jgi:hypothetical protein
MQKSSLTDLLSQPAPREASPKNLISNAATMWLRPSTLPPTFSPVENFYFPVLTKSVIKCSFSSLKSRDETNYIE